MLKCAYHHVQDYGLAVNIQKATHVYVIYATFQQYLFQFFFCIVMHYLHSTATNLTTIYTICICMCVYIDTVRLSVQLMLLLFVHQQLYLCCSSVSRSRTCFLCLAFYCMLVSFLYMCYLPCVLTPELYISSNTPILFHIMFHLFITKTLNLLKKTLLANEKVCFFDRHTHIFTTRYDQHIYKYVLTI